jgi:hypothetical protein
MPLAHRVLSGRDGLCAGAYRLTNRAILSQGWYLMGPTKVVMKDGGIYDAKTWKLIKDGLSTHEANYDYAAHHYLVPPVVNKTC